MAAGDTLDAEEIAGAKVFDPRVAKGRILQFRLTVRWPAWERARTSVPESRRSRKHTQVTRLAEPQRATRPRSPNDQGQRVAATTARTVTTITRSIIDPAAAIKGASEAKYRTCPEHTGKLAGVRS
jgi:hypothetical protein